MLNAGRLGVDLTKEVHIHGVVDGDKVIQLGDDLNIVGVIHRCGHHIGVLLDVVIQLLGAGSKGIDLTASVHVLVAAGDLASLGNIHESVHIHLGVHAQILQVGLRDQGANGIGHTADAQLQAGAVGDLLHDHLGNLAVHIGGRSAGAHGGHGGVLAFHDHVNIADVDLGAGQTVDPRHILVDFHDDLLGMLQHIANVGSRNSEAEVAVGVHGSHLDHSHIRGGVAVPIETGQLRIAHGAEIAHALADDLAVHAAAVPGVPGEVVTSVIRLAHLGHPHGHAAVDLHVKQLVLPGSQSLVQSDRLIAAPTVIHPVTGLDNLHRFLSGSQLLLIQFLNIHRLLPPYLFCVSAKFSLYR